MRRACLGLIACCSVYLSSSVSGIEVDDYFKDVPPSNLEIFVRQHPPNYERKIRNEPIKLKDDSAFTPVRISDLPDLSRDMETKVTKSGKLTRNGLLSTINASEFLARRIDDPGTITIPKSATGFEKDLEATLLMQRGEAPLAVPILGFGMLRDGKMAQAYIHDLFLAGNHVLCTDSIVTIKMNEITGHGVAGNTVAEARVTGLIIDAFLKMANPSTGETYARQVKSVRLLGTSWGGVILMHILRLPRANQWPIDRALVVSAPLNLSTTAMRLDKFHREDRNRTGILELAKLQDGYTPRHSRIRPEELIWMRAGLGYIFHGDLALIAENNAYRYTPKLVKWLKSFEKDEETAATRKKLALAMKERHKQARAMLAAQKGKIKKKKRYKRLELDLYEKHKSDWDYFNRRLSDFSGWSFKHYIFLLAKPYWKVEGDASALVRMHALLEGTPNFVQYVISTDDPLNDPGELTELTDTYSEPKILVLPDGGHLGITGTQWFQALMKKFFNAGKK